MQKFILLGLLVLSVQCAAIIARASNLAKIIRPIVCSIVAVYVYVSDCLSVTFLCKVNALISYDLMKSYDIRSYEFKKN